MPPDGPGWVPPPRPAGPPPWVAGPTSPVLEPFPWSRALWTGIVLGVVEGLLGSLLLYFLIVLAPLAIVFHGVLAVAYLRGGRRSRRADATGFGVAVAPFIAVPVGVIVVQVLVASA